MDEYRIAALVPDEPDRFVAAFLRDVRYDDTGARPVHT
jgi:predicted TIM-barrel fold metal-dependent hydrolase